MNDINDENDVDTMDEGDLKTPSRNKLPQHETLTTITIPSTEDECNENSLGTIQDEKDKTYESIKTPMRPSRTASVTRSSPITGIHTSKNGQQETITYQSFNKNSPVTPRKSPNSQKRVSISINVPNNNDNESFNSPSKGLDGFFQRKEVKYYRIVYRGIVSLLSKPDLSSKKSGAYVSYGEIIASTYEIDVNSTETAAEEEEELSSPQRIGGGADDKFLFNDVSPIKHTSPGIPRPPTGSVSSPLPKPSNLSSLPLAPSSSYTPPNKQHPAAQVGRPNVHQQKVIQVKDVLTGGFAIDAEHTATSHTHCTPRRSNGMVAKHVSFCNNSTSTEHCASPSMNNLDTPERQEVRHHGYLFLNSCNGFPIAEQIPAPPLLCQPGRFYYRVISKTPLPILAGPCSDAPLTRGLAMPGTVHEISLRMGSLDKNGQSPIRSLEDGVVFLRLSHRRGWIADRRFIQMSIHEDDGDKNRVDSLESNHLIAELVMKEIPDYVDVTTFDISDDMSLGGTSISSASFATPSTIILSRRRPVRHKKAKDSRSGMIVQHKVNDKEQGYVRLSASEADDSDVDIKKADSMNIDDSNVNASNSSSLQKPSVYLMRVTAPRGLKMLDAPHFQVSTLMKGQMTLSKLGIHGIPGSTKSYSPRGNSSWEIDASGKFRILPRGALFEASSKRLEKAANCSIGSGLIKLADGTGWAIVPNNTDLQEQYNSSAGINIPENEMMSAYEEVGNAINNNVDHSNDENVCWVRVIQPQGVLVSCSPDAGQDKSLSRIRSLVPSSSSFMMKPSSSDAIAVNKTEEVGNQSSVNLSFFDSFRTSRKSDAKLDTLNVARKAQKKVSLVIPCGSCVKVDPWASSSSQAQGQSFARLCGEQGWIPRLIHGMQYSMDIKQPDIRTGSFWFRVQPTDGIKVRIGPSARAPEIKSSAGYFVFECGEYLRVSEILTIHGHADVDDTNNETIDHPSESFARLYRKQNPNTTLHSESKEEAYETLSSLTSPGEWVHVHCNGILFLEECIHPPKVERNIEGWRYESVAPMGVEIRKGPSFAAKDTGTYLQNCAIVLVNERVTGNGSAITWLRLKDGRGWVQNVNEQGDCIMKENTGKTSDVKDGSSVNKLISRLGLHR
jgi:hypothetical protein